MTNETSVETYNRLVAHGWMPPQKALEFRSAMNALLEHYLNIYDGNKDELAIRAQKLLEET